MDCTIPTNKISKELLSKFIFEDGKDITKETTGTDICDLVHDLLNIPLSEFLSIIDGGKAEICLPRHIPQYSDFDSAIFTEVNYLAEHGKSTLNEIGSILPKQVTETTGAQTKYGENHSKLLEIFGIATVDHGYVSLTEIGRCFSKLNSSDRQRFTIRCIFRTPIIRNLLFKSKYNGILVIEELNMFLSESTAKRRLSNTYSLLKMLKDSGENSPEIYQRLSNIKKS